MPNYHQVVEQVRLAVFSPLEGPTEALRQTAAGYKAFCEEINTRLAQCGEMLRKGYRSEALRLAETEPNLLDLVSLADFPERAAFVELCQYLQLDVPPPLLLNIASAINEAYSAERPLEEVLRRYRRYALAKAPLKKRLRMLRVLADMDSANIYWQKDLETFERARLDEIRKELGEAVQSRNLELLGKLEKELTEEKWKIALPLELIQSVQYYKIQISRALACIQLKELNKELHEAWSRFDLEEARKVRSAWQEMADMAQIDVNDPLVQEAAPALQWIQHEDEKEAQEAAHRQAVAELEQALDREKPLAILQRLYRRATAGDHNLPAYLERQYQLRVDHLARQAKIRMWQKVLVGILVSLLLAAGAGWGIVKYRSYREHAEITKTLQRLVAQADQNTPTPETLEYLHQAKTTVDQLKQKQPPYLAWVPLPELFAKIETLLQKEALRKQQLDHTLKDVEEFVKQVEEQMKGSDPENPVTKKDFDHYETMLQEADGLAVTDKEKIQLNEFRRSLTKRKNEWQEKIDHEFQAALDPIVKELGSIEKVRPETLEAIQKVLQNHQDIAARLTQLEKQLPDISTSDQKKLTLAKEKCQVLEKEFRTQLDEKNHDQRLIQLVGKHDDFVKELQRWIEKYPASSRSAPYQRLIKEEPPYWKQMDHWNGYARQWHTDRWSLISQEDWIKEFKAWQGFPGIQALEEFQPYLKAIRSREEGGTQRLQRFLKDPLSQQVWVMKYQERIYYLIEFPKDLKSGVTIGIRYIKDFEMNTKTVTVQATDPRPIIKQAPHTSLCKDLLSQFNRAQKEDWEKKFCEMLDKILTFSDQEIPVDPIFRLRLLKQVLDTACEGSYPMYDAFRNWNMRIQTAPFDLTANWLDPESPEIEQQRKLTAEFLQKFTLNEFAQHCQQAADLWKQFQASRLPQYRWIGVLLQDSSHTWQCRPKDPQTLQEVTGTVYVVVPKGVGAAWVTNVGTIQGDTIQLQPAVGEEALVVARPVFAAISQTESSASKAPGP